MRVAINRLDVWPGDGRVISYLKSLTGLTGAAVRGGGAAGSDCSSHGVHWNLFCGPVRRPAAARQGKLSAAAPSIAARQGLPMRDLSKLRSAALSVCPVWPVPAATSAVTQARSRTSVAADWQGTLTQACYTTSAYLVSAEQEQ